MAKLELNPIIASSLDNFLIFENDTSNSSPFVTFSLYMGGLEQDIVLTIVNADDATEFTKIITGSASGDTTASSFNITGTDLNVTLSLLECIKMNSIFNTVTLENSGGTYYIKAYLDTSRRYGITSDNGQLTVSGNFSYYNVTTPNKFTLMLNSDLLGQMEMQKYSTSDDVSFNVSSPFQHLSQKYPSRVNILGYKTINRFNTMLSITNSTVYVLPTTISKFTSWDYADYTSYGALSNKVKWLTNNTERNYNYDELCALSVLSNTTPSILKKYYTNGGTFLSSDTEVQTSETTNMRTDFYFTLNISEVEEETQREVGYVEVTCTIDGNEIVSPVRYNVMPKCNENHTLFFINSIGGVDSFTFLGETIRNTTIDDQSTYFINPVRPYTSLYELEYSKQKKNKITTTLTTTIQNMETAEWLNEIARSKYVFRLLDDGSEMVVIVDKMDIEVSDRETEFEVQCEYYDADNNINV